MADPNETGTANRRPKTPGTDAPRPAGIVAGAGTSGEGASGAALASAAGGAAGTGTELARSDLSGAPSTTVTEVGTAARVADPALKPVVLGAAEVPVEAGGPGAGALRTAEETASFETRSLEDLDRRPLNTSERAELELLRRRVGIGAVVDAAAVPGLRWATAATTVKRNGISYAPGRDVPLDYEGYVELVAIGAITDTPWRELEPASES